MPTDITLPTLGQKPYKQTLDTAITRVRDAADAAQATAAAAAQAAANAAGVASGAAGQAASALDAAGAASSAASTAAGNASTALNAANTALNRILVVESSFSAAAYTAAIGDAYTAKRSTSANPVTVTLPPAASVPWIAGQTIEIVQGGSGQITVVGGTGVTVRARDGLRRTAGLEAAVTVRYVGSDIWHLTGDVDLTVPVTTYRFPSDDGFRWSDGNAPQTANGPASSGFAFKLTAAAQLSGVRFQSPSVQNMIARLFDGSGVQVAATAAFDTVAGLNDQSFVTPFNGVVGPEYTVSVHVASGVTHAYYVVGSVWTTAPTPISVGPVTSAGVTGNPGRYGTSYTAMPTLTSASSRRLDIVAKA